MSRPEDDAHAGCDIGAWASANDAGQMEAKTVGQLG
jgi:hypothetical protein